MNPTVTSTDRTSVITNPAHDQHWRQFLYNYYKKEWARTNGSVTLEDVYNIARKRYEMIHKQCDIELGLMANKRKHKKF